MAVTCSSLAQANTSFSIIGVNGKLWGNIQSRLNELDEQAPLYNKSDEELQQQVAQAMSPYGYFNPQITISRKEKDHSLKISISSGERTLITHFMVKILGEGEKNVLINNSIKKMGIETNKPFNSQLYEKAKQSLLSAAEKEGYLHAFFEAAKILINKKSNTVDIKLILNTGPRYYFGAVTFSPSYISPDLLKRYLPYAYEQPFSTEQLTALNNSLSASGYFKQVSVQPQFAQNTNVPVQIQLQDASPYSYSLGLGFGTDTGPRGRAGYNLIPVNQYGHKFNAIAMGSLSENRIQGQYLIPGLNPLTDQYSIFSSFSTLNYNVGYSNSALLSLGQKHETSNFQRAFSLNSLYESFSYQNHPKYHELSFYPKLTLGWSNKQDQIFAPNGYHITFNALAANKAFFSDLNFSQASIDAKAAFTVDPIKTRLYFHSIQGITNIKDIYQLPMSLAPLLGGTDNLKGYSFNSIGPGKIITYSGLEIQKETKENWYLTGFFDMGNVYNPSSSKKLLYDAGLGLMWVSPIGPIKIGVAQPIDSHFSRFENRGPRLVISMGPEF
jgi:translocation and assembly module TamA